MLVVGDSLEGELMRYVIEVRGVLDGAWGTRFEDLGFELRTDEALGCTRFISPLAVEQTQLHAALRRVRDMGLELLRVEPFDDS